MSPCFVSNSLTCKAIALLEAFVVLKKPMVITWQDSHLSLKTCAMRTNLFTFVLDIHKSKFMMQELLNSRALAIYFSLVFSTIISRFSLTMVHLNGEIKWGFYFKVSLLKSWASRKDNGFSSLTINNDNLFQIPFGEHHSKVRHFITKKKNDWRSGARLFFCRSPFFLQAHLSLVQSIHSTLVNEHIQYVFEVPKSNLLSCMICCPSTSYN